MSWTPLALTLGLHLLLVLAWLLRAFEPRLPVPPPSQRETLVVMVQPPAPVQAAAPRDPSPPPKPAPTPRRTPPAAGTPSPVTAEVPTEEPAPVADTPSPSAFPSTDAPLTPAGEDMLAAGKRSAAAFDREQRKGKSGVPEEADTPWSRFRTKLAAAHIDRSLSISLEKYEAPDGVIIYRTTQGGKQTCQMSGAAVFGPGRAGGGSAAGSVSCPKGVRWERL